MRKIYFLMILVLAFFQVSSQSSVPYGFNYQSIARDALGVPIVNSNVSLRISIIEANVGGVIVYQETQNSTTNQFGLLNLVIGKGTNTLAGTLPNFASIDWASNNYYVLVEVNRSGTWISLGISQFQSVPFALASDNALKIQNQRVSQVAPTAGQYLRFNAVSGQWEPSNLIGANGGTVVSISGLSPIVIGGNVGLDPQISIQQSGSGVDGYLSGLDWAIFNSKIGPSTLAVGDVSGTFSSLTVTALNGNQISSIVPTNGQYLVWNGILNQWEPASASFGTVTSVSGNGPISVSNGGSTPNISISQANITTDGYITQADYQSFTNKLSTSTGFSGDISGLYSSITVDRIKNTPIDLTGLAAGQVLSFDGTNFVPAFIPIASNNITTSTADITVSGLNIEIGTASGTTFGLLSPTDWLNFNSKLSQPVSIVGVSGASVSGVYPSFTVSGSNNTWLLGGNNVGGLQSIGTSDNFDLPFITNGVEAMRITTGGDVLINTTSTLVGARLEIREAALPSRPSVAIIGGAGNNASIVLGRVSAEGGMGVAGSTSFFSNLANPGDLIVRAAGANNNLILSARSTGDIIFATGLSDTPKMTLTNAGTLSIVGVVETGNLKINSLSNGILSVDGLGNVISTSLNPNPWVTTTSGIYYPSRIAVGNAIDPLFPVHISAASGALIRTDDNAGGAALAVGTNGLNIIEYTGGIQFKQNTYGSVGNGLGSVDVAIQNGKVGIGTTTPNLELTVFGSSSVTGIGYFGTLSGLALNGATPGSIVTVDGFGTLGFGSLPVTSPINWISTSAGITYSNDNIAIGTTTVGGAKLKVNGDISASGQVIASSTMMPTGTAASSFSLIYKQRIYIPNGTSTINGSLNTYKYLAGGVGIIRIKIGSITMDVSASTNNPNAFEPIPDIDVSTLAGTYQTVEILGQADSSAEGVMVQSFLLTSHN